MKNFFTQKIPHFFRKSIPWFFTRKVAPFFRAFPRSSVDFFVKLWPFLVVLAVIFVVDIMVKYIIQWTIDPGQRVAVISGFFHITRVYNTGGAFGFSFGLSRVGARIFLLIFTGIALIGFFIAFHKFRNGSRIAKATFAMIIAGALGNFYDRLFIRAPNGYFAVRDMFAFTLGTWPAPVFNVADIALVFGVILFGIYFIFLYRPQPQFTGAVVEKDWKWNGDKWEQQVLQENVEKLSSLKTENAPLDITTKNDNADK